MDDPGDFVPLTKSDNYPDTGSEPLRPVQTWDQAFGIRDQSVRYPHPSSIEQLFKKAARRIPLSTTLHCLLNLSCSRNASAEPVPTPAGFSTPVTAEPLKKEPRDERRSGQGKLHLVRGRLTTARRPACVPAPTENKVLEAYEKAKKAKRDLRDSARPGAPAQLPQLLRGRL